MPYTMGPMSVSDAVFKAGALAERDRLKAVNAELVKALAALHACHRAFSSTENWTVLDDEAREAAETALEKAGV